MVEKCKKCCAEVRVREMEPKQIYPDRLEVLVSPNSVGWDKAALLSLLPNPDPQESKAQALASVRPSTP